MKIVPILLTILLVTTACAAPAEDEVVIGGLFGLTGFAAFAGETAKNGMILALEDHGSDIRFVIEDHESSIPGSVTAASKLIDVNQVDVIIGPEWAEFGQVIMPISSNRQVLFVSPWMDNDRIVDSEYYFSATASARNHVIKQLEYMQSVGVSTLAIIHTQNAWANGLMENYVDEAPKYDIEIIETLATDQEILDYKTELVKVRELGVDAMYSAMASDEEAGQLSKQMNELSIDIPHYIPFTRAESTDYLNKYGQYLDGNIYVSVITSDRMKVFEERYMERFNRPAVAISGATAYDMTTLVLQAIDAGATNSDEIREYLRNVKDYEGYSNTINFNELGMQDSEVLQIKQINGDSPIVLME